MSDGILKPCKCGKVPESITRVFFRNSSIPNRFKVICDGCKRETITYETEKGAIAAWNKREE